jgi:cell division protein FtsA
MTVIKFPARSDMSGLMAGRSDQVVAALDIGSSNVSCIIAQRVALKHADADPRLSIKIIGFGQIASKGIRSGSVVDVEDAERAIRLAVDAAEKMAKRSISKVVVCITGGKPQSVSQKADLQLAGPVVTQMDIDHALVQVLKGAVLSKRAVLHLAQLGYQLDGVECERVPLGLHGRDLSIDVGLVTVSQATINNLKIAIERAHLEIEGFTLAPLASARAVLTPDEMELGTAIIDIGASVTSVGVIKAGRLVAADALPMGSHHVTLDIAQCLSTSVGQAERLKTLNGTVLSDGHEGNEMLSYLPLGEEGTAATQTISRSALSSIIRPRVEELLEQAIGKLLACGQPVYRVVLTGGGANLQGIREVAQVMYGRPVRLGVPRDFRGMQDVLAQSGMAACCGLLCQVLEPERHHVVPEEAVAMIERQQMTYGTRLTRWFKEAL